LLLKKINTEDYIIWLKDIKSRIHQSQIKAAVKINTEMLNMYWDLGEMIIKKQSETKWGDGLIDQLSKDLNSEFPSMKGFSYRNLSYIRKWVLFYTNIDYSFVPQLVAELNQKYPQIVKQLQLIDNNKLIKVSQVVRLNTGEKKNKLLIVPQLVALIPWGHNREIITKCRDIKEALFYVTETIKNNWSRAVLVHQIESGLYLRQGKAITNFELTLPKPQSDLAREIIKDPYNLDFITLAPEARERDLENALIENLTKFLLELGAGFAFLGKQYHLEISGKDFYIDLLFYHIKLRCFIVIDLKIDEFKPDYAGNINFYLSAIDDILKTDMDNPSVGIILCKSKDKIIVEYALRDIKKPIGVSEYRLTNILPDNLKDSLPNIEELEKELTRDNS